MIQRALTVGLLFLVVSPVTRSAWPAPGADTPAEKVKAAFERLKAKPGDRAVQKLYLKVFPRDYKEFLALFGTGGSLADGYECDYIFALSSLQAHHSNQVGRLLVQLSKDAEENGAAPSCFQHVVATYGGSYTKAFVGFLYQLAPRERQQLINFLADADPVTDPEYQRIIENLRQLHEAELAKKFQQAQTTRLRPPHS
jgi:hypothetical protein